MTLRRRTFLGRGAAAAAFAGFASGAANATSAPRPTPPRPTAPLPPGLPGRDYRPVHAPNGSTLPFRVVDGVKIFHLVAEAVDHIFADGLTAVCWGYNGRVHGPVIEAVEGDRVRIYVTNKLPQSTTVHWHGLYVPSGMDGVGGLSQRPIEPGETFLYEFTLVQHGTFMYHSHHDEMTQMALGLMGMMVIHPRNPTEPPADRDYVYMLSEWALKVGARRPDPNEMTDFNVLTLNAKAFPATAPMLAKKGDRVRIRFGNLSAMDHHPMHLHGTSFTLVGTDGGVVPPSARYPETTVLVPVGTTRTVEFVADALGDWAMHCHMTHHVMTQMGHDVPNAIGVDVTMFDAALGRSLPKYRAAVGMGHGGEGGDEEENPYAAIPKNSTPMAGGLGPRGFISMGGMVTVLQVRETLDGDGDPGWYEPPPSEQARPALADELRRDGVPL
jgi:manganese oxidase